MNAESIALIVGVLIPALISVVKQANLKKVWNTLIAIAVCGLAGLATVWGAGQLNFADWLKTAGIILGAASTVYAMFWRPSGIDTWIDNLTTVIKP